MSGKKLAPLRNRRRRVPRDGWEGPNRRSATTHEELRDAMKPHLENLRKQVAAGGKVIVCATDFYAHLDACRQCAESPFGLCPTGAKLLEGAAR